MVFSMGCKGVSSLVPGARAPPPSLLTLVSAELLLSYSHSSLLLQVFSPLLKCVIPEELPVLLMGSALASGGSILELAGIGFIGHGGIF